MILVKSLGMTPVVPPKSNRRKPWEYDKTLYKRRNEAKSFSVVSSCIVAFLHVMTSWISCIFHSSSLPLPASGYANLRELALAKKRSRTRLIPGYVGEHYRESNIPIVDVEKITRAYTLKEYGNGTSHELLTMFVQLMFSNPYRVVKESPEFFAGMMKCLK